MLPQLILSVNYLGLSLGLIILCGGLFISRGHVAHTPGRTVDNGPPQRRAGYEKRFLKSLERALDRVQDPIALEALAEGQRLSQLGTKASQRKAIGKYEEALKIFQASKETLGQAVALLAMASSYVSLNENQQALKYSKEALPLMEAGGDPTMIATVLSVIGTSYGLLNDRKQALEYLDRALPLLQGDDNRLPRAAVLLGIANVYAFIGERRKAIDYYHQALVLFRSVGEQSGEATTLSGLAAFYSALGDQQKALGLYNELLRLLGPSGDPKVKSTALSGIGNVYSALGDKQKALDYYDQALTITRVAVDAEGEAIALNNIGLVYSDLGQKQKALDYFNQALKSQGRAKSLGNIGSVYSSMGEYQKALDFYSRALVLAQAEKDIALEAGLLTEVGTIYLDLNENRKALDYFRQALPVFQFIGDRDSEAATLNRIGVVHESTGEPQKALDYYNQALTLGIAIEDRGRQAAALNGIGMIYFASGERRKALESFTKALSLVREIKDREAEPVALNNIGAIYVKAGEREKALEFYNLALSLQREMFDRSGESTTLANIGSIYEEQGRLEEAADYYQKAIEVLEKVRVDARLEEFKLKLDEKNANVYANAILANMRLGRHAQAFDLSERARARTFLDQLGNARVDTRKSANEQFIQKEQVLRLELAALGRQIGHERAKPNSGPNSEAVVVLEKQLRTKRVEYEDFLTDLKLRSPEYASIFSVNSLKLADVQKLLDNDTTLLAFFVTLNKTIVFVITRDSLHAVSLPIAAADLDATIASFRGFNDLSNPYPQSLKRLYELFITPLEPYLKTRQIGIIPHNVLHYLPFAALTNGQRYFGEQHLLFYLPSASVLPFIQQKRKPVPKSLLALSQGQAEGFPLLQYANKTAEEVAALYDSTALTGTAATETAFRARASSSDIIFIAAHGKLSSINPLFSRIVLAPDKDNDGLLEVHEVYGLDLKSVSLVVLSACQTQLGERSQGDDIIGLNRAFIFAGTPTVVASLWSVQDKQTGQLMVYFFQQLKGGKSKAEALQAAQGEMRAKYPHPYYWAAFVLTGDVGTTGN
jgi:CHAT domain-containing protein/uncharacterized protein HemY